VKKGGQSSEEEREALSTSAMTKKKCQKRDRRDRLQLHLSDCFNDGTRDGLKDGARQQRSGHEAAKGCHKRERAIISNGPEGKLSKS